VSAHIKVGDFVRVASGPAYVPGIPIKGNVQEIDGEVAIVKVASGGEWGFNLGDLKLLAKRTGAVLVLLLMASGARADVFDAVAISAAASDVVSTEVALKQGYVEQNIQVRGLRVGANVVLTGVTLLAAHELERNGHKGWSRAIKVGLALAWGLNTARNVRTMNGGLR
jgi:hypothetical protein